MKLPIILRSTHEETIRWVRFWLRGRYLDASDRVLKNTVEDLERQVEDRRGKLMERAELWTPNPGAEHWDAYEAGVVAGVQYAKQVLLGNIVDLDISPPSQEQVGAELEEALNERDTTGGKV